MERSEIYDLLELLKDEHSSRLSARSEALANYLLDKLIEIQETEAVEDHG